jgi:hypothetical protein
MKKITFTLSFLFIALFSYGQCNYQLQMIDSYGDGWGFNNSIDITVGQVTTNYTLSSGASSTVDLPVTIGDAITAVFNCGGSYCYEASYRILNSEGTIVANNPYSTNVTAQDGIIASCPSCSAPTALSAANIMVDSAEISWTSDGTSFNIEVVDVTGGGAATGTATYSGVTSPYSLTGLSSVNNYAVYVQTDCGGDQSSWVSTSFTTLCETFNTFPYLESFETITSGQPDCWSLEGTTATSIYHFSSFATGQSGRGMRFNSYLNSSGRTSELITPVIDATALTTLELNFQYKNPTGGNFEVLVSSDNGSTYTSLATDLTGQTDWALKNYDLTSYISSTMLVKFKGTSNYGSGDAYVYLDEVGIREIPSCQSPTSLTAASLTADSAEISWTSDGTSFDIEVVDVTAGGVATGTATYSDVTSPYSLTGLSSQNDYKVYVQRVCGLGDTSSWVSVSFSTLCSSFTAPYSQNFDSDAGELQQCWNSIVSNSTSTYSSILSGTTSSVSTTNTIRFYNYNDITGDYFLVSPNFSDLDDTKRLRFSVYQNQGTSDEGDVLEIGTMTDPSDSATYTTFKTIPYADRVEDTWVDLTVNFDTYTGTDNYIAIKMNFGGNYNLYYFDDFYYEDIPSCVEPANLTATAISNTGAVIDWVSDGSAFMIEIQLGGVAQGTPNSGTPTEPSVYVIGDQVAYTTTSVDLTGFLDANTSYSVYVVNVCQGGNSLYSGPLNFTTEPNPIVPNYINDFSTFPGDLWSEGQGSLNNGPGGTSSSWLAGQFSNGTIGAASINIWSSTTDEWLISPTFDLSSGTFYLNVDASATQYGSQVTDANLDSDDFVTLMASIDDGSTWAELYRWDAANNPGAAGKGISEISLENYTATSKFAFYAESSVYISDSDFFIKNFQITNDALGIEEISISQFTYFPNPVNDQLTINAQANVDGIAVLNMLGQVVSRQSPNSLNCVVDMAALRTGVYFVQVSIGNKTETVRVLKQ